MDLIKGGVPTPGNRELTDEEKMIKEILRANLNLVLTGAPGTGKTFMAKKIARDMTGDAENTPEDHAHIASVQFHPGYDYSDFVIGMKPILVTEEGKEVFRDAHGKLYTTDNKDPNGEPRQYIDGKRTYVSYDWKDGVFKKFAAKAKGDLEHNYVFLIDEINRADLSRVFGELFSLLEEEYRYPNGKGSDFILLPNGERFSIPKNLYIIGTMNDIDRSVESIDFALRRRFAWYEVKPPDPTSKEMDVILKAKVEKKKIHKDDAVNLDRAMKALNEMIAPPDDNKKEGDDQKRANNPDLRLGSEYQLGGAIFAKLEKYVGRDAEGNPEKATDTAFTSLWNNHIKNILSEYLRGRRDRVLDKLESAYNKAVSVGSDEEENMSENRDDKRMRGDNRQFRILYRDGSDRVIFKGTAVDTLREFVVQEGVEKIAQLGIALEDRKLLIDTNTWAAMDEEERNKNYYTKEPIAGGYYLLCKTKTSCKVRQVQDICERLGINAEVVEVELQDKDLSLTDEM